MKKQNSAGPLRFRFLPTLFAVDDATYSGIFKDEPINALYNLGFDVRPVASVDDAGLFLWQIADSFLTELSRTEGLELSRENTAVSLTSDLTENLLSSLPFLLSSFAQKRGKSRSFYPVDLCDDYEKPAKYLAF